VADVIEPRILRGFRDYLPDVMAPRDRMVAVITDVFHRFGFAPLATPCLEYADILLGKYGEDAEMLLYRFTDNGGRDVCLRYDLTVPLARVVAQYPDLPRPFKRYQIAPVWRAEKPGKGRFREFVQCDVDIVGADGLAADAECIQVDHAVMTALGVKDFHIRLNHRKVLNGLGDFLDADAATMRGVLRTVDKLDKIGLDAVHDILVSENHLSADRADRLVSFLCIQGDNAERLARAAEVLTGVERAQQGLAELRAVLDLSEAGGVPAERLVADLSVARGLDYYTGAVFETTLDALPAVGSVMSGGRYDELISIFTGKNMPAVGISVGLDRLLAALQELGVVQAAVGVAQVFVTVFDAASRPASTGLAAGLRAAGFNVELSLADDKLGRQFKQADRLGARAALVLGPDEQASGVVTLKDLKTAQQETVAADRLIERLRAVLQ
jgi:histidyl-tRNA synthetase